MASINSNISRVGNATSSEIVALLSVGSREMTPLEMDEYKLHNPKGRKKTIESWPGDKALTYIEECNMERRLGRSLTNDVNARPLSWGKLLEPISFGILGLEYTLSSQETLRHDTILHWLGSSDGTKNDPGKTVMDIKNPMTLKSFCMLVDPMFVHGLTGMDAMNAVRNGYTDSKGIEHPKHADGEKYYWQLVSNSILEKCQYAELIVHMPYKSQLEEIRETARNYDGPDQYKFFWISVAPDEELPHLIDGGFYKNINIMRFEVPQADKDLLTQRVVQAGRRLITI